MEIRTLTDADIEAIATALQERLVRDFYKNLGKGVFGWVWRAVVIVFILAAFYGATREGRLL